VAREVPKTQAIAAAALRELMQGPTDAERAGGMTSTVESTYPFSILTAAGVAHVDLAGLSPPARAQVVYTLTQFPTVEAVEIENATYTRADFEDLTPAILVESPLSSQRVTSPLRVIGTANTFEATFEYELTDPDGLIVSENFVTATSGSGTRGTFDFTIDFATERDGLGELIVFERSAKDGSRINLVEIPLWMSA
jgi:DNA-binding transcriptional regulator YdaS (Cro superfamily)